jgi:hypothetical protein
MAVWVLTLTAWRVLGTSIALLKRLFRVIVSRTQEDEPFMSEYMQHLDEELNENSIEKLKGVDIDMSCVADLLRSVEEGSGQPGAAEGLIGMLGMRLPKASR